MRTIRFRGISIDTNEMVYGDLLQYRVMPVIFDKDKEQWEVKANTVGEFTGLFDKQGKEIYEGDVVITNHETNRVVFASGSFCLYNTGEGLYEIHSSDINIIGNIHENLELL